MQGQDSVEIRADIELGGNEQLFNLMVGRDFQQRAGQEPQVCLTLPILRGLDGQRRMGKSLGNYIGVGEPAREQFGKTMSIPDELLKEWFDLLTDRSEDDIARLLDPKQTHPMEAKKTLAADIVTFYYGPEAAKTARSNWETQFSAKQDPDEIPEAKIAAAKLDEGKLAVCPLLVEAGLASSNKEARRKIGEGAVTIGPDRRKITDPNESIAVETGLVLRLGRRIVRVSVAG
jgi:tyrosyl-tRNA synthetase